jgi:hypothetical protein
MPRGFAHRLCTSVAAMTAVVFIGLVGMAGASCGGSVSSSGTDGGSAEGSPSGGASASPSGGGSPGGSSSGGPSGSASGAGSPGGPSSTGGPPSGTSPPIPGPFAGMGGPGCTPMNVGGAGGGQGECTSMFGETCGGIDYQATCACPQGTCACFGPSTHVISFKGCPACPGALPNPPGTIGGLTTKGALTMDQVFALCGFPH